MSLPAALVPGSVDVGSAAKEQLYVEGTISIPETAQFLGVCTKTVRNMIQRGELPSTRVARAVRISRKFLVKMLAQNHRGPI